MARSRDRFWTGIVMGALAWALLFDRAFAIDADRKDDPTVAENKEEVERERREWFELQRGFPVGSVPAGARLQTWQELRKASPQGFVTGGLAEGPWINIGPAPQSVGSGLVYSNRIEHLAADPGNASHWIVSAPGGGLWETFDAGSHWAARTDDMPSLSTGAIAFAPSNPLVVYSGIGEPGVGGVLKSTDGGSTWQLMATSTFSSGDSFAEIRVHGTNPSILTAATWSFFLNASTTGIWKSVDGGLNWNRQLTGRAMDLEVDPSNFNRQYTILGGGYPDPEDGVYRYNGTSWSLITGPWGTLTGNTGCLAIAPSNASVLYVSIRDKGIWKTSNAWAGNPTWTALPAPPEYVGTFVVDRTNTSVLWGGGVGFYRFDGTSWSDLTRADQLDGMHVDQRYISWAGTRLLVGNDGGVFSTLDGAAHWLDHNTNLSVTQFYAGSLHPTNPSVAMGGTQDDGTPRWTGASTWSTTTWGDGMSNFFSSTSPNTTWSTSVYYLNIYRTRNGGGSYDQVDSGIDPANRPFFGKFDRCPSNENIVIAGSHALWKTTDFFTAPAQPAWSLNGPEMNDSISAVAFAPSSSSCQIYAYGNTNSELHRTTNGGGAWADLDPLGVLPTRSITDLAFHPGDANTLYVTMSGYDENTPGRPGHLFKTANALSGSPTWTNLSPPGSNVPFNSIALDPLNPSRLYVGTDLGVWRSLDGGATWIHMGPEMGMPDTIVNDLQFNRTTSTLAAFTYGRGALILGGGSGAVPETTTGGGTPLTLSKTPSTLSLTWGASCAPGDLDYEVYEGTLGAYYSHTQKLCTTGRATTVSLSMPPSNVYYLVVATNSLREGSYGRRSNGVERPQGTLACLPQAMASGCP